MGKISISVARGSEILRLREINSLLARNMSELEEKALIEERAQICEKFGRRVLEQTEGIRDNSILLRDDPEDEEL